MSRPSRRWLDSSRQCRCSIPHRSSNVRESRSCGDCLRTGRGSTPLSRRWAINLTVRLGRHRPIGPRQSSLVKCISSTKTNHERHRTQKRIPGPILFFSMRLAIRHWLLAFWRAIWTRPAPHLRRRSSNAPIIPAAVWQSDRTIRPASARRSQALP